MPISVKLLNKDVEELRQIHEQVTGEKLSLDETRLMGQNLVWFGHLFHKLVSEQKHREGKE